MVNSELDLPGDWGGELVRLTSRFKAVVAMPRQVTLRLRCGFALGALSASLLFGVAPVHAAVVAGLSGGALSVFLGAGGDSAIVSASSRTAGVITVSGGGITPQTFAGVNSITVEDGGASPGQSVSITNGSDSAGCFPFSPPVTTDGIESVAMLVCAPGGPINVVQNGGTISPSAGSGVPVLTFSGATTSVHYGTEVGTWTIDESNGTVRALDASSSVAGTQVGGIKVTTPADPVTVDLNIGTLVLVGSGDTFVIDVPTAQNPDPNGASSPAALDVVGGTVADVVNFEETAIGLSSSYTGGGAADTISIGKAGSVQNVHGPITVSNLSVSSSVTVDDSADTTGQVATLSNVAGGTQISGLAPATITASNQAPLTVNGGTGANTFNVTPSPSAHFLLNGGSQVSTLLSMNLSGVSAPALSGTPSAGLVTGRWTFANAAAVDFSGFGELDPTGVLIADVSGVTGPAGTSFGFPVTLLAPDPNAVSVPYATADGTAHSPADYTATSGTLVFPANSTTPLTVSVTIAGSSSSGPGKTFTLDASSSTHEVPIRQGTGTITYPSDSDLGLNGLPSNISVNATSPSGALVNYVPPTAADEAGDNPAATVSCAPASGSVFAIGATTVTCTASDSDDTPRTVSQAFIVTVNDTDLDLSGVPANMSVIATSSSGAVVTYATPTVVDEDSPAAAASCAPASGSTFAVGTTTVTCTATSSDDTPSVVTRHFTVTVSFDLQLVLSITPHIATTGTVVTVSASLTNNASVSRQVTIQGTFSYISPNGKTVQFTSSSQSFTMRAGQTVARSFSFTVTKFIPRGTYSFKASATDVIGSVSAAAAFIVT